MANGVERGCSYYNSDSKSSALMRRCACRCVGAGWGMCAWCFVCLRVRRSGSECVRGHARGPLYAVAGRRHAELLPVPGFCEVIEVPGGAVQNLKSWFVRRPVMGEPTANTEACLGGFVDGGFIGWCFGLCLPAVAAPNINNSLTQPIAFLYPCLPYPSG